MEQTIDSLIDKIYEAGFLFSIRPPDGEYWEDDEGNLKTLWSVTLWGAFRLRTGHYGKTSPLIDFRGETLIIALEKTVDELKNPEFTKIFTRQYHSLKPLDKNSPSIQRG